MYSGYSPKNEGNKALNFVEQWYEKVKVVYKNNLFLSPSYTHIQFIRNVCNKWLNIFPFPNYGA